MEYSGLDRTTFRGKLLKYIIEPLLVFAIGFNFIIILNT